jgi:DNA-binding XRE family transcriptional regulator
LQKDLAAIIGVTEDCITLWENNRSKPYIKYYRKIIEFLGYLPFDIDDSTLAGKLKLYRYRNGFIQEELADILGVNESTVFYYEKSKHAPSFSVLQKFSGLISK